MKIRRLISYLPLPDLKSRSWPDLAASLASTLASQLGNLLTVKIAVSLVPPAEYGIYSLVAGAVALSSNLVFNQLLTERARNYFDAQAPRTFVRETFSLVLRYSILTALAVFVWLAAFRHRGWHDALTWSAVSLIIAQPLFQTGTLFAEINSKFKLSLLLNSIARAAQLAFLIALIFLVGANATAITLAQTLGMAVALALLLLPGIKLIGQAAPAPRSATAKMMSQGHWLLIYNIATWVLATSDRYIIGHFRPLAELGEYAINYGLWSIPFLTINVWLDTFFRPKFYLAASEDNWSEVRRLTAMRALAAFAFCCVTVAALYAVGPWIAVRLLAGPYWTHVRTLLLYITIAHTFYVMGNCVYTVLLALKRTHPLAWATTLAAIAQVVLNVIRVPRGSIIAAAFDTLASYALWFVLMAFVAYWYLWRRHFKAQDFDRTTEAI